ncbi:MAG: hypothetical protein RL479_1288 [Verrucomicrobiota bacterium]|jgi:hypothetical protein
MTDENGRPKFLVVGLDLKTPVDAARDLDRALRWYAHVYACLAESCDFERRLWLQYRPNDVLEELALRGDEGAGIEIERRRWARRLADAAEFAARAGVALNPPAFDPDRPLGPGTMVRWAAQGPLDYAGRKDSSRATFKLGEWVEADRDLNRGGTRPGAVKFETTDELPWHDPRVPESGAKAEALRTANAQKRTGMSGLFAEVNDPSLNAHPLSGRKKRIKD